MFRPIELPRRGRRKKDKRATVIPARRTLNGKRISSKDIRRITEGVEKGEEKKVNSKKRKTGKNSNKKTCDSDCSQRCKRLKTEETCKKKRKTEKKNKEVDSGLIKSSINSTEISNMGAIEVPKDKKRRRRRAKAKTCDDYMVKPQTKSLNQLLTPGKKGRDKCRNRTSPGFKKPKTSAKKTSKNMSKSQQLRLEDQGPKDYSREDLEAFMRKRLLQLKKEQVEVGALHCRIAEMEKEAGKMNARHLIHKRRAMQKEIDAMREKTERIESGIEISEFCREAASFFYSFDQAAEKESDDDENKVKDNITNNDEVGFSPMMQLAEDGLQEDMDHDCSETKGDIESKDDDSGVLSLEQEFEDGVLRDEYTEFGEEESVTREQVPVLVMPHNLQDMISERQRHVTKADMRVLTSGKASANVIADNFLEKYGMVSKPLCTINDETCIQCSGSKLVYDAVSDTLVCSTCRAEQTSTQNSEKNIGYNNSQNMHFSTCRYQRITHFMTCVDRFCGWVGSSKITNKLLLKVMNWLIDKGIEKIKVSDTEAALKDLGLSKLTIHKTVITARITGIQPPRFTPDQRHQLIEMFIAVEAAFSKLRRENKLEGRLNFLNVNYTLYKFVELLDWGQKFLKFFKLLRGKENLARQDTYWAKVCKVVDFPFIRSV